MRVTREQWAVRAALAAAVSIGLFNGFRYGFDFFDMLLGGRRFLAGTNLYEGSGPAYGMIGPPAQAVLLAPFALVADVHMVAARACWFAINFAGLVFGARAWSVGLGLPRRAGWIVIAAAGAVAFPLYREFQAQNMTLLLFWLMGVAAAGLATGRHTVAGIAVGSATAIKLFPGLAIVYLVARARWTAARAAVISAVLLSAVPVLRYGPAGFVDLIREWTRTRTSGDWPIWDQNQSVSTAISRVIPGELGVTVGFVVFAGLVLLVAWQSWQRRAMSTEALAEELALVLAVSMIASPIAWVPYWLLCMPLFMVVGREAQKGRAGAAAVFVVGAFLVTIVDGWRRSAPGGELLAAAVLLIVAVTMWLPSESARARS